MLGAAILCSRGALRSGAGLVYLGAPLNARDIINLATPEVIVIGGDNAKQFFTIAERSNAVAIGPGLGERKAMARDLLLHLKNTQYAFPIVVDADGLNALSGEPQLFKQLGLKLILTPHPGEMGKLIGKSVNDIQKDRKAAALSAAERFNSIVVLKGYRTVVADPQGKSYINQTGNPGMATAGVGDVLTGMIAGLAAQGFSAWDAAVFGVYLHGRAGDLAAKEKGESGMIASDLIEKLPYAISKNS